MSAASGKDDVVNGAPPFRLTGLASGACPILIAVPHAGRAYDPGLLAAMRHPDATRLRLEDRYIDLVAQDVAARCGAALLVAQAPRAAIDLNRAPDDVDWSMIVGGGGRAARHSLANRRARSGLGIVPRRLPGSGEIWRAPLPRGELERRIDEIHRPYHECLAAALETLRDRWGAALLVDLHSMPPLRRRFAGEAQTEYVIGDRFGASCAHRLAASAMQYLGERGRAVAHNRPYSGGYVLDRHGAPLRGIHAMQIEVCRSTYLCAELAEPSARLPAVGRTLAGLVRHLADEVAFLADSGRFPLAAE